MTSELQLFDYEKEIINKYIATGEHTEEEINRLIEMIISMREKPDKNPQLNKNKEVVK